MLLAQTLVSDDLRPAQQSAQEAIEQLRGIPAESEQAATAKTQIGRLQLLILQQPAAAERTLREAVDMDDRQLDAYYMLWKLLELTGRADQSEPTFWRVYELSSEDERAVRLREWYLCQFYPVSATANLERMMGLLEPEETPDARTELRRFGLFRNREPRQALAVAAIANWFRLEGDPAEAVRELNTSAPRLDDASQNAFLVSARVASLFDVGEFDAALEAFQDWPGPREGYVYSKLEAMLLDEAKRDDQAALAAYRRALQSWPGPADWRTMNRMASCLSRLGRREEAEAARARAKKVERLMDEEVHQKLRSALARLDDQKQMQAIVDFYEQLGCSRETEAWTDHIERLRGDCRGR